MKTLSATLLTLAGVFAVASASQADTRHTRDPGVNARQHNQRERIQQGVRSGELTRRETGRLVEEQRDVRQLERAYKSDGTLTGAERRDLQHEQNQASRDIYRQKHDEQDRPPAAVRDPGVNQRQANQTGPHRAGREVGRADARRSAGAAHRAQRHPRPGADVQVGRHADAAPSARICTSSSISRARKFTKRSTTTRRGSEGVELRPAHPNPPPFHAGGRARATSYKLPNTRTRCR